jgi:hypothetical protein
MTSIRIVHGEQVIYRLPPNINCPCGSGRLAIECCLTKNGFIKTPARTQPPPPITEYSLGSCYAASLEDCSLKLSREHYISESLLRELDSNESLSVSGFHWQPEGEQKSLSPKALSAKILCERHNAALSKIDSIAVRLFRAFDEEHVLGSRSHALYLFSGGDIERWLLKSLCGFAYTGGSADDNRNIKIPKDWLDILFGRAEFSNGQGLYICRTVGHIFKGGRDVRLQTIYRNGVLSGLGLFICGYELILSMFGMPTRAFDGREVVYRPLELYVSGHDYEKSVVFSWQGDADLGTITLQLPNITERS